MISPLISIALIAYLRLCTATTLKTESVTTIDTSSLLVQSTVCNQGLALRCACAMSSILRIIIKLIFMLVQKHYCLSNKKGN